MLAGTRRENPAVPGEGSPLAFFLLFFLSRACEAVDGASRRAPLGSFLRASGGAGRPCTAFEAPLSSGGVCPCAGQKSASFQGALNRLLREDGTAGYTGRVGASRKTSHARELAVRWPGVAGAGRRMPGQGRARQCAAPEGRLDADGCVTRADTGRQAPTARSGEHGRAAVSG